MTTAETAPTPAGLHDFTCVCSSVSGNISGEPVMQVYCHCKDCRKWYQTSPVGVVIYPDDAVHVDKGEDKIKKFSVVKAELKRSFCGECGFRLWNRHDMFPFRGVVATAVPNLEFRPQAHVYCMDATEESLKHFHDDGLPKFVDQPPVVGGTGKQIESRDSI